MYLNVSQVAEVQKMVMDAHMNFGRLDVLVNAAGINLRQPAATFSETDWDALMNVNLKGAFFACQAAGEVMRAQGGGKIINPGSLSFEIVVPNIALYAVSKGGLR